MCAIIAPGCVNQQAHAKTNSQNHNSLLCSNNTKPQQDITQTVQNPSVTIATSRNTHIAEIILPTAVVILLISMENRIHAEFCLTAQHNQILLAHIYAIITIKNTEH